MDFRRLTPKSRGYITVTGNPVQKSTNEKLYRLTAVTSPDPATQVLRKGLLASRLPFQSRQRRPLTPDEVREFPVVRCRPVGSRPTTAYGPPSTLSTLCAGSKPPSQQRPRSTPVHGLRTPHNQSLISNSSLLVVGLSPRPPPSPYPGIPWVDPGRFDTLSSGVLSKLLNDVRPRPASSSYGDRIMTLTNTIVPQGKKREKEGLEPNLNDDVSTTSGIESDGGEEDEEEEDVSEDDNSSDSEDGGFEPSLDDLRRQIPHPQDIFPMRPEKLDAIYTPEDKRDMRRFDFDATKVDLPVYEFRSPLPNDMSKVNLRLCAREGTDWQGYLTSMPAEGLALRGMVDRLVELEKYQIITEEWETRKLRGQRQRQEKLALSSTSASRVTSTRVRDRRCCAFCLQAACVGDCPEKRQFTGRCEKCSQLLCTGSCQDSRYEQRMRHTRSSDDLILDEPLPLPLPRTPSRGCYSCLKRHNAKIINANNLMLGRPKSSNATYSRGQFSCRPTRDLRPYSSDSLHAELIKDFERLGIEPQQPSLPNKTPNARPRSRNGLLPGKSSRSNRKNSISEPRGRKKKHERGSKALAQAS